MGHTSAGARESVTQHFAEICAALSRDVLPEHLQRRTQLIVLDTLGAMLSAARPIFPGPQRLAAFVQSDAPTGACTIIGTSMRTSATDAALMNGYLAYALDIESHHGPAVVHAAAAVLPAALAEAQMLRADGARLVTGVALGIEVACRVSLAIGPNDLYERGFHPTAIAGAFGAAAAVASLRQGNAVQFARAFGLAATATSGLLAWASDDSEESRPLNPGLAARNGLTAGRLAALGFGAPVGVFDAGAKYSVFRAWSEDGVGQPQRLLAGLGEEFAVDKLIIKQHACCAFLHPAVDALLDILVAAELTPEQIEAITIRFPQTGAPIINSNPLRSHRAQYILPLAAVRRAVEFLDVLQDRSLEPAIARLIARTNFVPDEVLDSLYPGRYATELELTERGGQVHRSRVDWARGTPENPLSAEEIVGKFRRLAAERVAAARIDQLTELVTALSELSSLDRLFALLTLE